MHNLLRHWCIPQSWYLAEYLLNFLCYIELPKPYFMKKILFTAAAFAFAAFLWHVVSGFTNTSSAENALRKRIAELEKQVLDMENNAGSCNFKYFDTETDLRKFVAENYNTTTYGYNTVAANTNNLKSVLSTFPANSTVYLSIIFTPKGRDLRVSNGERICTPFGICCPPNCGTPPPPPKSIALSESINPFTF